MILTVTNILYTINVNITHISNGNNKVVSAYKFNLYKFKLQNSHILKLLKTVLWASL